jgi:hypothetical protein
MRSLYSAENRRRVARTANSGLGTPARVALPAGATLRWRKTREGTQASMVPHAEQCRGFGEKRGGDHATDAGHRLRDSRCGSPPGGSRTPDGPIPSCMPATWGTFLTLRSASGSTSWAWCFAFASRSCRGIGRDQSRATSCQPAPPVSMDANVSCAGSVRLGSLLGHERGMQPLHRSSPTRAPFRARLFARP